MRETLFNWLGQDLYGKRCLDLFAGSGALGMEAASRGAAEVVMVEKSRAVYAVLKENVSRLGFGNIALRCEDGLNFAMRGKEKFDVIFLDPPFQSDSLAKLIPLMADMLAEDGLLYIESGSQFEAGAPWHVHKQGKAGAVHYQLLTRLEND